MCSMKGLACGTKVFSRGRTKQKPRNPTPTDVNDASESFVWSANRRNLPSGNLTVDSTPTTKCHGGDEPATGTLHRQVNCSYQNHSLMAHHSQTAPVALNTLRVNGATSPSDNLTMIPGVRIPGVRVLEATDGGVVQESQAPCKVSLPTILMLRRQFTPYCGDGTVPGVILHSSSHRPRLSVSSAVAKWLARISIRILLL